MGLLLSSFHISRSFVGSLTIILQNAWVFVFSFTRNQTDNFFLVLTFYSKSTKFKIRVLLFIVSMKTSIALKIHNTQLYPIHTEIFAPKINEINFIPGRTVFVTSEKYRPTNHRPRTALCH